MINQIVMNGRSHEVLATRRKKWLMILALPLLIGRLCDVISQKQSTDGKAYKYAKISVVVDEITRWRSIKTALYREVVQIFQSVLANQIIQSRFHYYW
jgi:hypothetical protein